MAAVVEARLLEATSLAAPFSGVAFRSVSPRYASPEDILSPRGSALTGGRYNPPREFGVLYLSLDPLTCLEETIRFSQSSPEQAAVLLPRTVVAVQVRLQSVLNLHDENVQSILQIELPDLVSQDWHLQRKDDEPSITLQIGRTARRSGLEGLIVPSAARPGTASLVVFSDQIRPGSYLEVIREKELSLSRDPALKGLM